jgi:hypothetical protein
MKEKVISIVKRFYPKSANTIRTVLLQVSPDITVVKDLIVEDSDGRRLYAIPPPGTSEQKFFDSLWDSLVELEPVLISYRMEEENA